jgi:hypothetical protein
MYRPASLLRPAELIPWNRFLYSLNVYHFGLWLNTDCTTWHNVTWIGLPHLICTGGCQVLDHTSFLGLVKDSLQVTHSTVLPSVTTILAYCSGLCPAPPSGHLGPWPSTSGGLRHLPPPPNCRLLCGHAGLFRRLAFDECQAKRSSIGLGLYCPQTRAQSRQAMQACHHLAAAGRPALHLP